MYEGCIEKRGDKENEQQIAWVGIIFDDRLPP